VACGLALLATIMVRLVVCDQLVPPRWPDVWPVRHAMCLRGQAKCFGAQHVSRQFVDQIYFLIPRKNTCATAPRSGDEDCLSTPTPWPRTLPCHFGGAFGVLCPFGGATGAPTRWGLQLPPLGGPRQCGFWKNSLFVRLASLSCCCCQVLGLLPLARAIEA